jgi:hypothetical protein
MKTKKLVKFRIKLPHLYEKQQEEGGKNFYNVCVCVCVSSVARLFRLRHPPV